MRDKFLTEAMGAHYHTGFVKCECGKENVNRVWPTNPDFSTWIGFGKLWDWGSLQDWWIDFITEYGFMEFIEYIGPDKLADAIYEYLQKKEGI